MWGVFFFTACVVFLFFTVLSFDEMHVAFFWLYVSWFHSQGMAGYGLAGPSARLLRATQ